MTDKTYKSILITGASSGLGKAMAERYAEPDIFLALTGRDAGRLGDVVKICQQKGAAVEGKIIDVTDRRAMKDWIEAIDEAHELDLVIANAGVSLRTSGESDPELAGQRLKEINIDGVLNTLDPIQSKMMARNKGQIALVSSMAAFRGLPSAPAYAASKAWVKSYGEGLRGRLGRANVGVSVICPGFVHSRITDLNRFIMPFYMASAKAAGIIHKGLAGNKPLIAFPLPMYLLSWTFGNIPAFLADWLSKLLPEKE